MPRAAPGAQRPPEAGRRDDTKYERAGDPWDAAAAGACAAALSVEGPGVSAIPDAERLEAALAAYRQALGRSP